MKRLGSSFMVLASMAIALMFAVGVGRAHAQPTAVLFGLNCGVAGPTAQVVPLVLRNTAGHPIPPQSYPFQAACKKHDACYAHWGISRGSCDQAFGLDMHAVCQLQPGAARADCEYVGEEYHSAVVRKGAAVYKEAQEGSVYRALRGTYTGLTGRLIISGGPNGTVSLPVKSTIAIAPIESPNLAGIFGTMTVTSPVRENARIGPFENIKEHPASVTGTAGTGFTPPPGYVGGEVQIALSFSWGGGVLPPRLKATFSGGSLVGNGDGTGNGNEPVTFSGTVMWTKSH